jgi:hypothetical protein
MQMNAQRQQAMLHAREQEAQMQQAPEAEQMGPPPGMQEMGGMEQPPMAMEDPGMMPPPESLVPQQMQQQAEMRQRMAGLPPGLNRLPQPPGMPGGNWNPMNAMGKMGNALGRFRGFNPFGGGGR